MLMKSCMHLQMKVKSAENRDLINTHHCSMRHDNAIYEFFQ